MVLLLPGGKSILHWQENWKEGGRDSRVTSNEGDVKVDIDDSRRRKGNKEIWKWKWK